MRLSTNKDGAKRRAAAIGCMHCTRLEGAIDTAREGDDPAPKYAPIIGGGLRKSRWVAGAILLSWACGRM